MVRTVDPITERLFDDGAGHVLSVPESNPALSVPAGLFAEYLGLNKFGRTTDADSGVLTDVWDGANGTTAQPIWLAPTAARIHALVSTDAADAAAGTGANTVQVYGLQTWASPETSEIISLDGLTPINTANSYVIIHRVKVLTFGSGGPNAGTISLTAAVDNTLTAQINPGDGQTQMAIYGVPSGQSLFMTQYYGSLNKAVRTAGADFRLVVNPIPQTQPAGFIVKHTMGSVSEGSGSIQHEFDPYFRIDGPAIIKLQVTTDTANSAADGGFDGYRKVA
jgi:hypothetical protein